MRASLFSVSLLALLAVAGCGGSGDKHLPLGPEEFQPSYVYVFDPMTEEDTQGRVDAFPNLAYTDFRRFEPTASDEKIFPAGGAFDSQGRLVIADMEGHKIVRTDKMISSNRVDFGTDGSGVNQFQTPEDIAIDANDRIYVTDFFGQRIVRIDDMNGTNWTALPQASGGNFAQPRSAKLDSLQRLYILSFANKIVRVDNMTGANPVTYAPTGADALNNAVGITIDANDRIYIADTANNRIIRMNDITGAGRVDFGTEGSGTGKFRFPQGIAIDNLGRILITDAGNGRIVRIDDMTGAGWTTIGHTGTGNGQYGNPRGIAVR